MKYEFAVEFADIEINVPLAAVDVGLNQHANVNGSAVTTAVPCVMYCPLPLKERAISYQSSGFSSGKSDITTTSSSDALIAPPENLLRFLIAAFALLNELLIG